MTVLGLQRRLTFEDVIDKGVELDFQDIHVYNRAATNYRSGFFYQPPNEEEVADPNHDERHEAALAALRAAAVQFEQARDAHHQQAREAFQGAMPRPAGVHQAPAPEPQAPAAGQAGPARDAGGPQMPAGPARDAGGPQMRSGADDLRNPAGPIPPPRDAPPRDGFRAAPPDAGVGAFNEPLRAGPPRPRAGAQGGRRRQRSRSPPGSMFPGQAPRPAPAAGLPAPANNQARQEARERANRPETLHQRAAEAPRQYRMATPSPRDHVLPEKIQKKQDERLLSFKKKRYPAVERPDLAPIRQRERKVAKEEQLRKKRESARQIDSKRPRQQERVIPIKRRNLGKKYLEARSGRREA